MSCAEGTVFELFPISPLTQGLLQVSADTRSRVMAHVRARFPPELLNRFDEMAIYNPLSREHMAEVRHLTHCKVHIQFS